MKKRIICLALIIAMAFSFSACGLSNEQIIKRIDNDILAIPDEYKLPCKNDGQTISFEYSTSCESKRAIIYIPYEYDENKSYNIIYGLGGSSANERYYFSEAGNESEFKNILDNMIYNNDIEPLIFVSDNFTFSKDEEITPDEIDERIDIYCKDVKAYLIPAVESQFSTYADDITPQGIEASREHRAFTGFSQGSAITWHMLEQNIDCFHYYMPISGSPFDNACEGYDTDFVPTLNETLSSSEYSKDNIRIYAYVGTKDYTMPRMYYFIDYLEGKSSKIVLDDNLSFNALEGGTHSYESVKTYTYNYLLKIFK